MSIREALNLFVQAILHAHHCGRTDCANEENAHHKEIMAKFADLTAGLEQVTSQIQKARGEIVHAVSVLQERISELEKIITDADVPEEVMTAFTRVKDAAQTVDDLNPDVGTPSEPPTQ